MRGRLLIGSILLLVGVGILLERLAIWNFGAFVGTWWPSLLILVGVVQLATGSMGPIAATLLIGTGALLQARELDLLPGGLTRFLLPAALILVGLWIVVSAATGRSARRSRASATKVREDTVDRFVAFGGLEVQNASKAFSGGSVTAMFGGAGLDLQSAELPEAGADLEVTALFGGVEVSVPKSWRVEVRGTPLFGGVEDATEPPTGDGPVLRIRATAIFGGVEVTNDPPE